MQTLKGYIRLNEALEDDNLLYKLDRWFANDPAGKDDFTNLVTKCHEKSPINKEILEPLAKEMLKFDISKLVDFTTDNVEGSNSDTVDSVYVLQKMIETILGTKYNDYNKNVVSKF